MAIVPSGTPRAVRPVCRSAKLGRYDIPISILLTISCLLLSACSTPSDSQQSFQVSYAGALKNIMRKGDISAKEDLVKYQEIQNLYALGALENLQGEIQIFDGQAHHSLVEDGQILIDSTFSRKATLLVSTVVKDWHAIPIPADIASKKDLEKYLPEVAAKYQIDPDLPFPFLIEGKVAALDWHVIDWPEGDKEHTHEKHIQSGRNGTIKAAAVEVLGFYSDSHHAIFTHHTTNLHMHVKSKDGKIAGHVDNLKIGPGMILKLPKTEKDPD